MSPQHSHRRSSRLVTRVVSAVLVGWLLIGVLGSGSVAADPYALSNESVAYLFFNEVHSKGTYSLTVNLVAADAVISTPDGEFRGPEGFNGLLAGMRAAFPDAVFPIRQMTADGDSVVVHWTMSGTHLGAFRGLAPSGATVTMEGVSTLTFDNGMIVDDQVSYDSAVVVRQIQTAYAFTDMEHAGGALPVAGVDDGLANIPYYMEHGGGPLPVAGEIDAPAQRSPACPPCMTPE